MYTCGAKLSLYIKEASRIALKKKYTILRVYGCLGFDTFGQFGLIGAITKGHSSAEKTLGL